MEQDGRFEVSTEAGDVGEVLRELARGAPDVILFDNHLPGKRGVDAIPALKEGAPLVRVLMLNVSENTQALSAVLQAGADGYLLKTVKSDLINDNRGLHRHSFLTAHESLLRGAMAQTHVTSIT